jgi:hypothetical protein
MGGEILSGRRKAFASKGDDCTMTRFVKTNTRRRIFQPLLIESERAVGPKWKNRPAVIAGRSIFHKKGVKPVSAFKTLLVSGHNNVKIGRDIRKGMFRGYWIYTLSFEERASCPSTCHHWETCYGNHMSYAKRIDHADLLALTGKLQFELIDLFAKKPSIKPTPHARKGVMVRLHALGDFFSVDYVYFWQAMLEKHPTLACYGYTAHAPDSEIGRAISVLKRLYGRRFAIRWSDGGLDKDCTVPVQAGTVRVPGAFLCPEQMDLCDSKGRALLCATCGLCWSTDKNVAFMEH